MKKLFLAFMMLVGVLTFAQTQKGSTFVGVSSNSVTGVNYSTVKDSGVKTFQMGVQGGYFVANNLAGIAGVGYQVLRANKQTVYEGVSYQVGGKYYVESKVPVQVDFNGVDKVNFIGTQLGYAFFPSKNFSIEPNARYDFALKNSYEDKFSLGVGFNYFF